MICISRQEYIFSDCLLPSTIRKKKKKGNVANLVFETLAVSLSLCLSTRVFETRTATGREHFACQGSGASQIFILIISNGEKILRNVSVVV